MSSELDHGLWRVDCVRDARDGRELPAESIARLVQGAADGSVPDYQLSAFLMAVYFRGLSHASTAALTLAMRDSGACLSWPRAGKQVVDKHSTGGVGDKISLHLAPWVAACGASVPMVAGRGLGHTGGTLDKLESIPGFACQMSLDAFGQQVDAIGCAIMGQSEAFAPADRTLYALRDVTATVESIPLITASILAKKLAEGLGGLVLDVKVGVGAFMKTPAQARALAESIVGVGQAAGLPVRALLTRMDAPLGRTIGNALEVRESLAVLAGEGPEDTVALSMALGGEMLLLSGIADSAADAEARLREALDSGRAMQRFCQMVAAQGGDVATLEQQGRGLPRAPQTTCIHAPRAGYVASLDAYRLGHAAIALGAGRTRTDAPIDAAVGLEVLAPIGTAVATGEPLLRVHHRDTLDAAIADDIGRAIGIDEQKPPSMPLVLDRLGASTLAATAPAL